MTFEELRLIPPIQRALKEQEYHEPTPVQAQTIPPALEGRDILGSAQTGTGKTAAFALPILNRLGKQARKPVPHAPAVLILAPTRELAIQIGDSLATYGQHLRVRHALVYGGVSQLRQVRELERGVHILVATPGRLLDLMNQGYIDLDRLEVFVLDEADRMLDMGFLPDIKRIMKELPEQRQSLFFSATLPPKIMELAQVLLRDPVQVQVTPERKTVAAIEQRLMMVEGGHKKTLLAQLLVEDEVGSAVVFTKTKRGSANVAQFLQKRGIAAIEIHGNKSQNARQRALDAFRRGDVRVLVATDVAARGIDVDGITHVFNVDLPIEPENYVHRIGRTGRAGATGIAISFCSSQERNLLRAIEQEIGRKVPLAEQQPDRAALAAMAAQHSDSAELPSRPDSRYSRSGSGGASRPGQGRRPQGAAGESRAPGGRGNGSRSAGAAGGTRTDSRKPAGYRPDRTDRPHRSSGEGSLQRRERTARPGERYSPGERSSDRGERRPAQSGGGDFRSRERSPQQQGSRPEPSRRRRSDSRRDD